MYIWEDEAYSLHTSSHNLAEVVRLSYNFEGQPAFYFVLLSIWRLINPSIFFARLLSIVFIGGSAYFFKKLVLLFSDNDGARWMLIIFLLNPFTVWAALEIRLYALVILLSTISIYCFIRYYLDEKNKYLYFLLITSLIGLYTQYFFALLITSFALSLLLFKGWSKFLKFCLFFIPVIILFLPNFIFLRQQISMQQTYVAGNSYLEKTLAILRTPQEFLLGFLTVDLPQYLRWLVKIPFIILVILGFIRAIKSTKHQDRSFLKILKILIFQILILTVFFIIVVCIFSLFYQQKYFLIAFPFFVFLFSLFLGYAKRSLIYSILGTYFISLMVIKYKYPEKTYDFKSTSNYIQKAQLNKEPIVFYGKSILPPFEYYYNGKNKLFTLPPLIYDKDYYEERIKDASEFIKEIDSIPSPTNSYLLVTESIVGFKYQQAMSRQMIQKSIKERYIITLDTTFKSKNSHDFLRVERLEKR